MFIDTQRAQRTLGPNLRVTGPESHNPTAEESPLMETFVGQEAPPPSYLEATTPLPWAGRPGGDEGARLLEDGGRVPISPMHEEYKDGKYRKRGILEWFTRRRVVRGLLVAAALLLVGGMFAAFVHGRDQQVPATPISVPAQPASSSIPISRPPTTEGGKQTFPIRWPARCGKNNYNVNTQEFDFGSPSTLSIIESVHQLDGPYKRVSGWIHVAAAPADQAPGTIQAKLSYAVSKTVDVASVKYAYTANSLTIGDPTFPDGFDGIQKKGKACLGLSVTLYVAQGATIENLKIQSTHLGMQAHNGVNFAVTNTTAISLTTGTLDSVSFNSRETHLRTISGSISGKYALFDLINIETKSGSVNVNIEPKEAVEGSSPSAVFAASSLSGTIRADFMRKRIPARDYKVNISATVGSVEGTFIHGSTTSLHTIEGQINADLLPYHPTGADESSTLTTSTTDGLTMVRLRSPYRNDPASAVPTMKKLVSNHKTISGAIDLTYPQQWEGNLEGQSFNGTVHLQGRDLELTKQEELEGFNRVEAKKGEGSSTLVFGSVSGGCEVKVGNLG
ncbi:hypothetical protein DM02DRAFT_599577 [Periconia macrospinosa]|uniref:Adhesin domain-containing protein n=1 Tax=Periconia macrospinosa TaxID=97972 RepID=A0A2V1DDN5_9PLEO|nr:hypothetical protein DM02DRAFT_599577 [Periconia macrospinosa]